MPTANTDRLVWIDLETFGLKAATDPVLEIGFRITDLDLNVVDDFQCVIWESPWFDSMYAEQVNLNSYVFQMHDKSGLWEEAMTLGLPPHEAGEEALHFLEGHGVGKGDPICGSSLRFDRDMLAMWYPKIDDLFSYRVIDVSSIKELCARYNPTVYARLDTETNPAKKHRVLPDMNDTINEFRFYRDNFLIAQ